MANFQWEFQSKGADDAAKMATAMNRISKATTTLTPALSALSATVTNLNDALRPLGDAFTKTATGVEAFRKAISPLIRYVERHAEAFRTLSAASANVSRATADTTAQMRQQTAASTTYNNTVGQSTTIINNFGRAMGSANAAQRQFRGGMLETLRAWNTANAAWEYGSKRLSQVKNAMTDVFSKTQKFGGGFESAERQLGVFMGANQSPEARKQFEEVVKAAELTAQNTTVGGADALNAAIAASKAGMKRGDLAKALPTIVNASIAEGMDASKIAEIGAITSSQFQNTGLGKGTDGKTIAADASGAIKLLQATAASSSTSIDNLFESMKNSASGATMLGMQLDETAAILSVLSQNGETGGRAGTRLMMAFSRMATQTPQATEAMKKLGVSFKDSSGNVLPFTQILDTLKTRLAGVQGNAQKMEYLKKIFGESFSSMAFLVEKGGDAIQREMQNIKNSMGVGDDLQKENMSGMAGAMEAFKGSYEQVYVSLRKTLSIPISQYWLTLANALNAVSTRFSKMGEAFKNAKTIDDWLNVLEQTNFADVFSGLSKEFERELNTLKRLASGIWTLIKSIFKAGWKEIMTEDTVKSMTGGLSSISQSIFSAIFTQENLQKAAAFGIELGKQILSGVMQTDLGKAVVGFGGAGLAAGGASDMFRTLSQAVAPSDAARQQAANAAQVTPATRQAWREAVPAENRQFKWRAVDETAKGREDSLRLKAQEREKNSLLSVGRRENLANTLGKLGAISMTVQTVVAAGMTLGALTVQAINWGANKYAEKQDARGVEETRKLILKLNLALAETADPTKRADIQKKLETQYAEYQKQTGRDYRSEPTTNDAAVRRMEEARAKRQADAAASTPEAKYRAAGMTEEQINRALGMGEEFSKAKNKKQWLETTEMFDKETRIKQLQALDPTISRRMAELQATQEEKRVNYFRYGRQAKEAQDQYRANEDRKLDRFAALQGQDLGGMGAAQYMRYQDAYAKAKASEGKQRLTEPQTQEEVDAALKRLSIEREIYDLKKKEKETSAQLANIPIDQAMTKNTQDTGFMKFLLEPINKFQEAMSGVIGKFMGVFEGLGKQRVTAGQKSGRLDEEGAKAESVTVLEESASRAEKMLKLAQTPGQRAESLQTQADKLLEISDITGDASKAEQADELLKRAQKEQGKQEDIELKKVELDRKLAQDNVKLLEGKRDGSASEGVARLQQLMESYQSLGDVEGAMKAKRQLESAQREAAGEQVKWLQLIVQELKLQRKGSEIDMQKQNEENRANTDKTVNAFNAIQNAAPMFDPGLAAPAY